MKVATVPEIIGSRPAYFTPTKRPSRKKWKGIADESGTDLVAV